VSKPRASPLLPLLLGAALDLEIAAGS
jgi:hypothetical protein